MRVWCKGDPLLSRGKGEDKPTEVFAADRDVFFVDGEIGDWSFSRGEDNRVDRLIYRLAADRDVVLRRIK